MKKTRPSRSKNRADQNQYSVQDLPPLDQQEVESLAYSYWEERASGEGSPEGDWFRAVNELRRRQQLL